MTENNLPKGVLETRSGVFYLGKEYRNSGGNVYFYTYETMGTAGEPESSPNFLGDVRIGRIDNPHSIISVKYAISEESYLSTEIKAKIQAMIKYLQSK